MFKKRHNMGLGFFGTTVSSWCNSARGPSNAQRATSNEHEYNYFSYKRVMKKYYYGGINYKTGSPKDAGERIYVHQAVQT